MNDDITFYGILTTMAAVGLPYSILDNDLGEHSEDDMHLICALP